MTSLSAGLETALEGVEALLFIAVEIVLPGHTIRLLDGAGTVTFDGKTFTGQDATFGTLGGIETFTDGGDAQAPRLGLRLLPPTATAAVTLADPAAQGSAVSCWFGAIDRATGQPVDDPDLWFVGELDVPRLRVSKNSRTLDFEVASVFEAFLEPDDGARLSNSFHQSINPGELGLQYVAEVQRQLPWGSDAPRPGVVTDIRGGGASGVDLANVSIF